MSIRYSPVKIYYAMLLYTVTHVQTLFAPKVLKTSTLAKYSFTCQTAYSLYWKRYHKNKNVVSKVKAILIYTGNPTWLLLSGILCGQMGVIFSLASMATHGCSYDKTALLPALSFWQLFWCWRHVPNPCFFIYPKGFRRWPCSLYDPISLPSTPPISAVL